MLYPSVVEVNNPECPIGEDIHLHEVLVKVYPFDLNALHLVSLLYDFVLIFKLDVVDP